jgi:regulator of cell morphogenesis and NO signaling
MANDLFCCTLAQLVVERPGRYRILRELGLDFCCGGRKTLSQACSEQGLDAGSAARSLAEAENLSDDAADAIRGIADHIDHVHHTFVRQALPRLRDLLAAESADPRIARIRPLVERLEAELMDHLLDEERTVFIFARSAGHAAPDPRLSAQINTMIQEHDDSGHGLERIRHLTNDYAAAPEDPQGYCAVMEALRELDADMHRHVYEENNLLFPLALTIAARMRG